jgi:putative PEP-CTERM system histidine kinase
VSANSVLAFAAAFFSGTFALLVALRKQRSVATWCFAAGMATLAAEAVLNGISFNTESPQKVAFWQQLALFTWSFVPPVWLYFSLTYSRGNYKEFLARWRVVMLAALLLPVAVGLGLRLGLIHILPYMHPSRDWHIGLDSAAKAFTGLFLSATVLVLMNLEKTFRSAVGTMRWRIKFVVLGLGVIFGASFYTRSQALIFSGYYLTLTNVETGALLIGCVLIGLGFLRSGVSEINVYPSHAVLQTSVTVLLAGAYLFVVGALAQFVTRLGGSESFRAESFVVLLGVVILALLLLSDRVRQDVQLFVSRHFKRPQHDFRQIWTHFTRSMSAIPGEDDLCAAAARLISETFNALSVSIWLFDTQQERLVRASSTSHSNREEAGDSIREVAVKELNSVKLDKLSRPFDLEKAKENWTESLKEVGAGGFLTGGNRICVPLLAGEQWLGVIILADRVNGLPYTVEEMDLLKCIGDQVAASLLNLRLTNEIMVGKELEAFQSISAFFVHDLKNTASTLSLMLQNLPTHFDDPSFRQDALRGVGSTVDRINHLISRMSAFPRELRLRPAEVDLNLLVTETINDFDNAPEAEFVTKFNPLPRIVADREQLQSVITNLLLNAHDAITTNGRITVETRQSGGWVTLSIADNGCGMDAAFLKDSLFRPFRTTKKKGLGIGMFQAKMIIEAHRGNIQVRSEPGSGTSFQVKLPLNSQTA